MVLGGLSLVSPFYLVLEVRLSLSHRRSLLPVITNLTVLRTVLAFVVAVETSTISLDASLVTAWEETDTQGINAASTVETTTSSPTWGTAFVSQVPGRFQFRHDQLSPSTGSSRVALRRIPSQGVS